MSRVARSGRSGSGSRRVPGALAAALLVLSLAACDSLPSISDNGSGTDSEPAPAPQGDPMDPEEVAAASTTAVDPAWLCRPGEGEAPPGSATPGSAAPGLMTPETVRAAGNEVMVSGSFRLEEGYDYGGFAPVGVLLPASEDDRGIPLEGYDGELGVDGAPVPPMVVRARVEVPGDGPAPSAVTTRLTVGTCDDAPLSDGQYLLRLSGGVVDGPGRGDDDAGWSASEDVLVDVVGGALEAVPGAVIAPGGEIPADLSPLACGAALRAVGEGDGTSVAVTEPTTTVSAATGEGGSPGGVTAEVTVTSEDLGTRALLPGIVLTDAEKGTVVAGARNAPEIALQWLGETGLTRSETAWTTQETCGGSPLSPGTYQAHAVAVTVDAENATHVVLSEAWDVEVVEEQPAS